VVFKGVTNGSTDSSTEGVSGDTVRQLNIKAVFDCLEEITKGGN
jgi:hypothetical protein